MVLARFAIHAEQKPENLKKNKASLNEPNKESKRQYVSKTNLFNSEETIFSMSYIITFK